MQSYAGSTRTFSALLDSMDRKGVVGFGFFIARKLSRPQMVVLIAQREKVADDSGVQLLPPGIQLCQLPFKDDIRSHGLSSTVSIVPDLSRFGCLPVWRVEMLMNPPPCFSRRAIQR